MGVQAVLAILVLFIATVKAQEGSVSFWKEEFTMICPGNGDWYKDNKKVSNSSEKMTQTYNTNTRGHYHCVYDNEGTENTYHFFVKGKVCEKCFELDPTVFAMVIVMDVLMTSIVMMIIYNCTKKKSSAAPTQPPRAPARPAGRGPPVPSPDYEHLNPNTRSQDTYSVVNRTG
ncbi:T-cell surface glycoprotein CD3 epsilon chain [Lates japonicus]|uniref:T-cell surface glycoprotein CD3 epsilon chain n=1 Tax=Lates japonicus TaxID=270547 RepID=A0AAD3N513_LATJO|nr:T-cell surface glycoprotein CD3 epsilon chain [Lates japonicus]